MIQSIFRRKASQNLRILVISNFYPPVRAWGYTQWCGEVSQGLAKRGHAVTILTSRTDAAQTEPQSNVRRLLFLENDLNYYSPKHFFLDWTRQEHENQRIVAETIRTETPDLVFVWGMFGLSRSVPATAEKLAPAHTAYYISDHWPREPSLNQAYWRLPARTRAGRVAKRPLALMAQFILLAQRHPPHLEFRHAFVVSHAVRRNLLSAGLPLQNAIVIHGGSDTRRYVQKRSYTPFLTHKPLRLLYAGFFGEHKGVHTAIEALDHMNRKGVAERLHLTLAGSGHPEYEKKLREMVSARDLASKVTFRGRVSPEDMPALFREHDVLVFPSIYEEPLARTVQEAMLSGLVVIGTTTGGTPEMLVGEQTGLTFEKQAAAELARQIERLLQEPGLGPRLAKEGQAAMRQHFTLDRMLDQIDSQIQCIPRRTEPSSVPGSERLSRAQL